MPSSHSEREIAWVRPAERVPGLVNVRLESGEEFWDLTVGQVRQLAAERDWDVRPDR